MKNTDVSCSTVYCADGCN